MMVILGNVVSIPFYQDNNEGRPSILIATERFLLYGLTSLAELSWYFYTDLIFTHYFVFSSLKRQCI